MHPTICFWNCWRHVSFKFLIKPLNNFFFSERIRGSLGSLLLLMAGVGVLLGYICGAHMKYNSCVWIYMIFPIIFVLFSAFLHETPFYLIKNQKLEVKKKSSVFYKFIDQFFTSFAERQGFSHVLSRSGKIRRKRFYWVRSHEEICEETSCWRKCFSLQFLQVLLTFSETSQ